MSRRQLGGYEFNAELVRIRNAANDILNSLENMLTGNLGTQVIVAHAAKMIRQIGIILDAIGNIEDFGEQAKIERTTK
jgi:hypothetical protein